MLIKYISLLMKYWSEDVFDRRHPESSCDVCTYNFASGVNFWGENYKKIIILLAKKN